MGNRERDTKKFLNSSTSENPSGDAAGLERKDEVESSSQQIHEFSSLESGNIKETNQVFEGTEASELEATRSSSSKSFKNYVRERGSAAFSTVLHRLSGKPNEDRQSLSDSEGKNDNSVMGFFNREENSCRESIFRQFSKKTEGSAWNPLNYIKIGRDADVLNKTDQVEDVNVKYSGQESVMKGRVLVYTRLQCQDCREVRALMHQKRLKFVEINVDIYPSRKLELEKSTGSSDVPRLYFNDFLVGGLSELKALDEYGNLDEMIKYLIDEELSPAAPLPPLPGEDDQSGSGKIDELASIVRNMKESIEIKDRINKMRKFTNCFLGSQAVDFLSEDQYFERREAVEYGRMLASKHFFQHVVNENTFEDGNHLYRFLEHDPTVMTQCYNITRGVTGVLPKPITEIASRLRFLSFAIFEAYVSENERHVDYQSIRDSEEFKRYLRTIEELQRVDMHDLSREEKLAFFINLYNMMAMHAILVRGYPGGALERRSCFGDFKYVIGGSPYSLSSIQNGILRGNQQPSDNLMNLTKPFDSNDKRLKVALPYPEPLVHFALAFGSRSGPALRFYSPGNIDKELVEAACDFLRNGGLVLDAKAKVVSASKILRWYASDFGKNQVEVLKHAANYLERRKSEELLELIASTKLKVIYQPYDWGWNC